MLSYKIKNQRLRLEDFSTWCRGLQWIYSILFCCHLHLAVVQTIKSSYFISGGDSRTNDLANYIVTDLLRTSNSSYWQVWELSTVFFLLSSLFLSFSPFWFLSYGKRRANIFLLAKWCCNQEWFEEMYRNRNLEVLWKKHLMLTRDTFDHIC